MDDYISHGWRNKETWLVSRSLGDIITPYQEAGGEVTPEYVKGIVEDIIDETGGPDLVRVLLNYAHSKIDYRWIANDYNDPNR